MKLTTAKFDNANAQAAKTPLLVLVINGVSYVLGTNTIYRTIRYDDPGLFYDGAGLTYDGLAPLASGSFFSLIDRKSSSNSTIDQKLEQWDGQASVQTMGIRLVDYNDMISLLASPGFVVEDLLNRKCKVFFGYSTVAYPEDFIRIFTGYVNKITIAQSFVDLILTDPSSQRAQDCFNGAATTLTSDINNSVTTIPLGNTGLLYQTITNAKGAADGSVTVGIVIDNEIITYTNGDITNSTTLSTVTRGAFGTTAVAHTSGAQVTCFINFQDNPMLIALKVMLSGWNGAWLTGLNLRSIINTDDGSSVANSITFASNVDLTRDYGVTVGDFIIMSGSSHGANNNTFTIKTLINNNRTAVVSETTLVEEDPGTGFLATVAAFRSQYDVYPTAAGLSITPDDVLVSQYKYLNTTFLIVPFNISVIGQESSGKTWVEQNIFKPCGAYALTQGARMSVGMTHPPLAVDLTKMLNPSNVVNAKNITVERGVTDRFFYNEVFFQYNYDVVSQTFNSSLRIVDADSQGRLGLVSVLEIDCIGLDGSGGSTSFLTQTGNKILRRYRYAAEVINLQTQFGLGNTIDAGDIVVLTDSTPPTLQIADTTNGVRGIYNRVMEVQEMNLNLSTAIASLSLLSNNGFNATDRFAVRGASSQLDPSFTHTTTKIRIIPSGSNVSSNPNAPFPGAEYKKWAPYVGSNIRVHDPTFTNDGTSAFTQDASDPNIMHLSSALGFTPDSTMWVEFEKYDQTSALTNQLVKATFCHRDSAASIASASSNVAFTLTGGFASRYESGMTVYVASVDGSRYSPDVKILTIVGNVVTIGPLTTSGANPNLGFTPSAGDYMMLAGFLDGGAGYRKI